MPVGRGACPQFPAGAALRRRPEPGVNLSIHRSSPFDFPMLTHCASSAWIFRLCAVSTAPFTPVELRSNGLAAPCARCYRLRGGALRPRLLPSLCPARLRSPEARSATPAVGQKPCSSPVHATCLQQTEVGCGQAPLVQQHPRVHSAPLRP